MKDIHDRMRGEIPEQVSRKYSMIIPEKTSVDFSKGMLGLQRWITQMVFEEILK